MSPLGRWALYYAGLGWAVFPLVPGTKSPFRDSHGSSEATTDVETITRWWTEHPEANIGTRPSAAGLYVYDVDPRNGGDVSHSSLLQQHGPFDSPLRVNSPSGGWHLYFAAPAGQRYDGAPATGIDGKYNGYAVLPPSVHPNGGRYAWAGATPNAAQAAPIPQFLVRPAAGQRVRAEIPGDLADVERITQALERLDPDDYYSWAYTMASLHHWETTGPDELQGVGYELCRAWSARSAKHDDGTFDDKWNRAWHADGANVRTLGSLLHDAGLTAGQQLVNAAAAFVSAPTEQQATWWTTVPVPRFKGSLDPVDVITDLHGADRFNFSTHVQNQRWDRVVPAVVWAVGGSCEAALTTMLAMGVEDSPWLRGLIAADAQRRTTWKTVYALNAEQQQIAAAGLMAEVMVDDGKLEAAERQILATLPAIPGLFQRGNRLCTVTMDGRVHLLDQVTIGSLLERWLRMMKGGKDPKPTRCPDILARRIERRSEYPGVPVLTGVISLPVARADGSIVSEPGIDDITGLYLQGNTYRAPRDLSPPEVEAAVRRIWSLFDKFPFATTTDRAAYMAALLTTAIRPTIETAPAFLINAARPGTGKTKLAECLMLACDAGKAANIWDDDQAEQRKAIHGILLAAPRGVLFDNVASAIKPTGAFCVASTSGEYSTRTLGSSDVSTVQNRAVWVLTGNNVRLVGDTVRRVLTVTLDSPENAEFRRFDFDPVQILERSAGDFRLDLLDLIHTWVSAGRPCSDGLSGFASFDAWSSIVRPLCLWLGFADPTGVIEASKETDPVEETLELMMAAWDARFGDSQVFLKDIGATPFIGEHAALWREAEQLVCTFKGQFDANRLAYWLRENKGKKLNGREFTGWKIGPRTAWKLRKI